MDNVNGMSWNDKTVYEKKYVMKDTYESDENKYASKGVAGSALGIGIGALALTLLGRNGGLANLLGSNESNSGCNVTCSDRLNDLKEQHQEMFGLYKSQIDADFQNYKFSRDSYDAILAKQNNDAFALFQGYTNKTQMLQSEIDELKTKLAVADAVRPYQDKMLYDAIALERERRECADCQIVNYANCTFVPQYIADLTPATTSTQKSVYNPLGCVNNTCGCNNR